MEKWQNQLKNCAKSPLALAKALGLPTENIISNPDFPLKAPDRFIAKIKLGDLNDPLLKQILPVTEELDIHPDFNNDPLQETVKNPVPGLLHKYKGRVLLTVSQACAIHCRYCFRRHFSYADNNPGRTGWQAALNYIREDSSIKEVIFSGGDPLSASDETLGFLIHALNEIPHLTTLRLHSRTAIVMPDRLTDDFIATLNTSRLKIILVTHCNHANELDEAVGHALQRLTGVTLLNQTVLLKGVNDHLDTLIHLSERLFAIGILPYYLHLLDKIQGAAHFDLPESEALILVQQLSHSLPGYLVPRLVREEPGQFSKTHKGIYDCNHPR